MLQCLARLAVTIGFYTASLDLKCYAPSASNLISRSRMREMVVWPSPNLVCLSGCLLRTCRCVESYPVFGHTFYY